MACTISLGQSGGRSSVRGPELPLPYRRRPSFHEYMSVVSDILRDQLVHWF
jgi:hypothetical protein